MKIHSLQLSSDQFMGCYQAIKRGLGNADALKQSYLVLADNINVTIDKLPIKKIDDHIEFIASRGATPELAVLLFGMISFLDRNHSIPSDVLGEIISQQINSNGATRELFIQDGTWNIKYAFGGAEFLFPKYDYELKEIVPESIIEIFQSVVLCLQNGLNIAALSLALVALETTLWDHLALKGIKKETETEIYPNPITASISWDSVNGYSMSIVDKNNLPKTPPVPVSFDIVFNRTGFTKKQDGRIVRFLNARVEDQYSLFLSDEMDKTVEIKDVHGLSVALQRARKEGLIDWDQGLDETFHIMRNKLIHQATDYEDIEIFTPNGNVKLGEFSQNLQLTLFFINRIKNYISEAYYIIRLESLATP
jgi:hypothetical protein